MRRQEQRRLQGLVLEVRLHHQEEHRQVQVQEREQERERELGPLP
jgi:hypothetical protein